MKKYFFYLVPALSILILGAFLLFYKPAVTGYVVGDIEGVSLQKNLSARISLATSPEKLLPESAYVAVSIGNESARMTVHDFIEKSGQEYNYTEGTNPILAYSGKGYIGNSTYFLQLSDFGINTRIAPGKHTLEIKVVYQNKTISENSGTLVVD